MGCGSSKLDDLPAVQLCRARFNNLSSTLRNRYLLADAHLSYIHSLESVGLCLHHFFDTAAAASTSPPPQQPPSSPPLKINNNNNNNNSGHLSSSHSGSHLDFHSSDDDDDDDDDHLHVHDHGSGSGSGSEPGPAHVHEVEPPRRSIGIGSGGGGGGMMVYEQNGPGFGPGLGMGVGMGMGMGYGPYMYPGSNDINYNNNFNDGYNYNYNYKYNINYMKKHVTPSVSYEQRPVSYETQTLHFGNFSNDYIGGPGLGLGPGPGNYGPPPGAQMGGGGGGGGWSNNGVGYEQMGTTKQQQAPPPPPPPAASPWDFINLFNGIEETYPYYRTPSSRDSREVREEEGIPELEDEDDVVVKQVHGHQKLVVDESGESSVSSLGGEGSSSGGGGGGEGKVVGDVKEVVGKSEDGNGYGGRKSGGSIESGPVEYDVLMVDKKVVGEEGGGGGKGGGGRPEFRNVSEVVKEIQVQFERAANAGGELGSVLEVGKLQYQRKNGAYQVSARMLNVITPSLPSTSKDEGSLEVDEDVQLRSKNLSAILQKLYLWEKKLLEEVKAEEEMRVKHDRKSLKLNRLIEKGAEPHKIEATRSEVRSLSTKIRIAIQIVDKISLKINKLRDEELWPQLNVLIQGFTRMWKGMLECHHSQLEAIDGAIGLDAIAFPDNPSDTHLEASLQLERDLLNWTWRFTEWIGAQKGYVSALNGWLMKCILYEPEETDDGVAPFSPGRAGAPPVFVICNQWSQSLERISETSEKELIDSMRVFSMMVLSFRERDKGELKQRMTANRDMERKVKNIEREDIKMQKKMVLASGDSEGLALSGNVVYQSDTSSKSSLQAGLRNIFEALKTFAQDSLTAYEELLQRSEEVVREHGKVSQ